MFPKETAKYKWNETEAMVNLEEEILVDKPAEVPEEEPEPETDSDEYMIKFVTQQLKEHVDPINVEMKEHRLDIKDLKLKNDENKTEIKRVDACYKEVTTAILQTNGLMVKDLDGHNIFKEHQKLQEAERKKLKDRKNSPKKSNKPNACLASEQTLPSRQFGLLNRGSPSVGSGKTSTHAHTIQNRLRGGETYKAL